MKFEIPKIYPITDTLISGIPHAEQVERLIAGGAEIIQLREKRASPNEFYEAAKLAVRIAQKQNVKIIINDRVDIALALKADGVHLGQDDLPPEQARAILGENAIIGYSTHTLEQALAAIKSPIDYLAFGPIFGTQTKENPDATVGLEMLNTVRNATGNFPMVAIGGINAQNASSVFEAGADSAAIISAILSDAAHIKEQMRKFIALFTLDA